MNRKLALVAAAAAVVSTAALAQTVPNIGLEPTFGAVQLTAGFLPDPHVVDVVAGGPIDAAAAGLAEGCNGFIAEAPDFRLDYATAPNIPLHIFVTAEVDTTLVINQPDGTWVCNDDTNGPHPAVRIEQPAAGAYEIWVGTYAPGPTQAGTLFISEIGAGP